MPNAWHALCKCQTHIINSNRQEQLQCTLCSASFQSSFSFETFNMFIVSLQWSPVVSLAAPPLTSATSAAQCRFWPHVGCCVLLRGVSFWSLVPVWLLCSEGPFRLWAHQHGMISPLNCVPC